MNEVPNNDQSSLPQQASAFDDVDSVIELPDHEQTPTNPDGFFNDLTSSQTAVSVRVALRVRPLLAREIYENSKICVDVNQHANQVTINQDRSFTFDKAFDLDQSQETVFEACVKNLVLGCFAGFNATVLAYGQTGSGKTFTMGSGFTLGVKEEDLGIIPRVIRLIFDEESKRKKLADFVIKCSFLEIYNEELIDLLDQSLIEKMIPQKKDINVREEKNGTISVYGLNEVQVKSSKEMADCLDMGSTARRTASTLMNQASSRSHGIFTVTIEQHLLSDLLNSTTQDDSMKPSETTVAKFHFVDLAGSERAKKTGATGSVLKEGININKSLLALGNVISALTEESKKAQHIPYRDSKLTRILQDSLGGNSRTSMIACCSPAESSFEETLNTLKYASRARNIKNKPTINRDPATQQIMELRQQVQDLQKEILGQRKVLVQNGIDYEPSIDVPSQIGDTQSQNVHSLSKISTQQSQESTRQLEGMVADLRKQILQKDQKIATLNSQLSEVRKAQDNVQITQLDNLKQRDEARLLAEQLTQKLSDLGHPAVVTLDQPQTSVLDEYRLANLQFEIDVQNLKTQLKHLQIDNQQLIEQAERDTKSLESKQLEIEKYKRSSLQWQAEVDKLSSKPAAQASRVGLTRRSTIMPQTPQKSIMSNRRLSFLNESPQPATPRNFQLQTPPSSKKWLSSELDHKIKHFDEIRQQFIDNLGSQVSSMLQSQRENDEEVKEQSSPPLTARKIAEDSTFVEEDPSNVVSRGSSDSSEDEQLSGSDEEAPKIPKIDSPQKKEQISQSKIHITTLDTQMRDKESLLQNFKTSQQELQSNLLDAMKEEYHLKVDQLSRALQKLEQEKSMELKKQPSGAHRSKVEDTYNSKQQELQSQLQQMARKDRDTKQMQKSNEEQQKKIRFLETDLEKLKTQKVIMQKKLKDDQEQLTKYKAERAKELTKLKQNLFKKEKENTELKREQAKAKTIFKRKQEELNAMQQRQKLDLQKKQSAKEQRQQLKQVDHDAIRNWIIENVLKMAEFQEVLTERDQKDREFTQIDTEITLVQQQLAKVSVQNEKNEHQLHACNVLMNTQLSQDQLQQLEESQQVYRQQMEDLNEQLDSLESKQKFVNLKIHDLIRQQEDLRPDAIDARVMEQIQSLEASRACISIFFSLLLEAKLIQNEVSKDLDLKSIDLTNAEQKLEQMKLLITAKDKLHVTALTEVNLQYEQRDKLYWNVVVEKTACDPKGIEQGDLASLFKVCFNKEQFQFTSETLKRPFESRLELKKNRTEIVNETKFQLSRQIAELEKKLTLTENHNQKLMNEQQQAIREKMKIKKRLEDEKSKVKKRTMLDVDDLTSSNSVIVQPRPMSRLIPQRPSTGQEVKTPVAKVQLQPQTNFKDARNARKLKQVKTEPEVNLDQIEVKQSNFKDRRNAKKAERKDDEQQKEFEQIQADHQSELDDVFNRLQTSSISNRRPTRYSQTSSLKRKFTDEENDVAELDRWSILQDKNDAHKTQILALAQSGNTLYSGSNKSVNVWDVESMQSISNIIQDVGLVKSLQICGNKNLLVAASGKDILWWDLQSLTKVAEFKGTNEIKCLQITADNMLFAGTKGAPTQGALLIFDIQKSMQQPVEEKEKNQDIFSLATTGETCFIGSRNHNVYPFNIQASQSLSPLKPPHYMAVTSLCVLKNDTLVSGSQDKHLRTYNAVGSYESQGSVMNAHLNQINCLASDETNNLYSGAKDGVVKVWRQDMEGDLKCTAKLDGNASMSSVNAMCCLDYEKYGRAFATANSDKSIRVWQQNDQSKGADMRDSHGDEPICPVFTQGSATQQLRITDRQAQKKAKSFV